MIWDFGQLSTHVEDLYIEQMDLSRKGAGVVQPLPQSLLHLVCDCSSV